jgi:acyl carrier protein
MEQNINQIEDVIISALKTNLDDLDPSISSSTCFADLAMDSMKTMMVIADLEKKLQLDSSISLELNSIYLHPTVTDLAHYIHKMESKDK